MYNSFEEAHNAEKAREGDKALTVRFFLEAIQDKHQSEIEGRPIFREVEFIEIRNPGDLSSIVKRRVNTTWTGGNAPDAERWPREWEAFKRGEEPAIEGTPLEQWQLCPRTVAAELKVKGIKTLEQLASMPDSLARTFPDGTRLKEAAHKHLNQSAKQIEVNKLEDRIKVLEEENNFLRQSLATLKQELQEEGRNVPGRSFSPSPAINPGSISEMVQNLVKQELTKLSSDVSSIPSVAPKKRGPKPKTMVDENGTA